MEILSPVKNLENAKSAIQNNCDAIYLASNNFGARVNANLEVEEIADIINYAKLYNVKTYITFNVVIFEEEIQEFLNQVNIVYNLGCDGIIIQDVSFINILKEKYPTLEIHCSTQMNIHNIDAINNVEKLGSNRVVLPREMNIENIKELRKKTDIEFEVFIHGALCVSYSGLCFDSTLLDQKSANRGRCSQYCRMQQRLINKRNNNVIRKGYLLNLRDMNNVDNVEKYLSAGINSIKIEGRLKQIDYVGLVTLAYYNKLNKINDKIDLRNTYNREFSNGRIMSVNGSELVNLNRPNNNGIFIGNIEKVEKNNNKKYGFYKYKIFVKTNVILNKLDNLRYVSNDETGEILEVFEKTKDGYMIYSKCLVEKNSDVYRTQNHEIVDNQYKLIKDYNRRVVKDMIINFNSMQYNIDGIDYNFNIDMQEPIKLVTTDIDIMNQFKKTKNSPYDFNITKLIYDNNSFINKKELNKLKNEIIDKISINKINHEDPIRYKKEEIDKDISNDNNYYFEVKKKEQYEIIRKYHNGFVIIPIELVNEIEHHESNVLLIPRVVYDEEFSNYDEIVNNFEYLMVSEIGALNRYNNKNLFTNFTFNTTNSYNQNFLLSKNVLKTYISIELNKERIEHLGNKSSIVNIYGRVPVMIMDYCPVNLEKTNTCGNCIKCRKGNYILEDNLDRKFPLLYEGNNRIGLYSDKRINLMNKVNELNNLNINNFYLTITDENQEEIESIMENIFNNAQNKINGSSGSYYKKVL